MIKLENKLTDQYICGLVQANGSFSISLIKTKNNLRLQPIFKITQHINNKDLILAIKSKFNNIGYWRIINKNNIIYEINNLEELKDIIIPFFIKNDLKSNKQIDLFKFKFIIELLYLNIGNINKNLLISLISIANTINRDKDLKDIRYLSSNEIDIVKNEEVLINISDLTNIINNYKSSKLNNEYIWGLFDGNGSLICNITTKKDINFVLSITQNINDINLIKKIKEYFNDIGQINYSISNNKDIKWSVNNNKEIKEILLLLKNNNNKLPIIKNNKVYYTLLIINEINKENYDKNNDEQLFKIIKLSYNLINNRNNMREIEYINKIKDKFNKN